MQDVGVDARPLRHRASATEMVPDSSGTPGSTVRVGFAAAWTR
jgi:hypothetical protein